VKTGISKDATEGEDLEEENRYTRLYRAIVRANARTVAHWQAYGFMNGVLNTDNTSILGLSIDFGPFAFLDTFDPQYTPNHDDHMLRYGTSAPNERSEIVSLRVTVTGLMKKPPQGKIKRGSASPPKSAFAGKRPVSFDGKFRAAPTYKRAELLAGNRISGPALIEEHASTTVLMPRDRMTVDAYGNLVIKVAGAK